ncbi:Longitudinals lacking protein, isoforms H/M/V [Frankliniella fusca]|uniref:Longitudinals lacking protein, isoforms H/M/V n=1 Tax=Frankliniella fusca TaxID=407009 RepID=A0AAE1H619_9NEOP|nr:Longitudinals lacking protein, isoforms H/M/V [Frankliniella fusca]
MADQQFCLRWNNHQNTLISVFDTLLEAEILVDCTLAAEGKFLRAHKVVLSACSPFFSDLLRQHYEQHPILIMKDVKFDQLKAMLDYMYRGEVKISQDQLGTFLKAAESLQIKGLSDSAPNHDSQIKLKTNDPRTSRALTKSDDDSMISRSSNVSPTPRRKKRRHHSGSVEEDATEDSSSEVPLESNSSTPPRVSVNSRLTTPSSPSTVPKDSNTVPSDEVTSRPTPFLPTSIYSESDQVNQQSTSLVDSVLCEPKSECIELDDDEEMAHEDVAEAGPSHKTDGGGYSWHMDRPEDSFMSQESLGGHRNAQGLINARMKLAHGLHALTETLSQPSVANENDLPVLEGLTENIKHAVIRLSGSLESRTEATDRNRNGKSAVRGIKSKKKPGPRCKKLGQKSKDKKIGGLDRGGSRQGARSRGPGQFSCPQCGRLYRWKGSLFQHLKLECGKEPRLHCPCCHYRCKHKSDLRRHVRMQHPGLDFRCGKVYRWKGSLSQHMRLECGKEPQFLCPVSPACRYRSKQRSGVNRHVRLLEEPIAWFETAGTSPGTSSSRNQSGGPAPAPAAHSHSVPGRYECPQCGRVYRWKGSLSQHLKLECGKEPRFKCKYCLYRARHKSHLKRHIIFVHPGKPFAI